MWQDCIFSIWDTEMYICLLYQFYSNVFESSTICVLLYNKRSELKSATVMQTCQSFSAFLRFFNIIWSYFGMCIKVQILC